MPRPVSANAPSVTRSVIVPYMIPSFYNDNSTVIWHGQQLKLSYADKFRDWESVLVSDGESLLRMCRY